LGVDTPEKGARAACPKEATAAEAASTFTKNLVANAKVIRVELKEHDKFGGRVLGDLIVDGQRLSELLIKNGHARAYFGDKKASWCN
jgi:endonuclease YncB( thermonuclease family)